MSALARGLAPLGLALVVSCGGSGEPAPRADAVDAPGPDEGAAAEAVAEEEAEEAAGGEASGEASSGGPDPITVTPVAPSQTHRSALASPLPPRGEALRKALRDHVRVHGRVADHGWLLGHTLLGLGPDLTLEDGTLAVDHLFTAFAHTVPLAPRPGLRFPKRVDAVPVEPHTDLMLKLVTDLGLPPTRAVTVQGTEHTLADLWRGSLHRGWIEDDALAYPSYNDAAWALFGLSTWAPDDLSWTAEGGHAMTLDGFTHRVVDQLVEETAFLAEAREAGTGFEKRKQGIFAYTCGGAHFLQAAVRAVARGFGAPGDRARMMDQVALSRFRYPVELRILDEALSSHPEYALLLLVQRLKSTGHHLETLHRASALGMLPAEEGLADEVASVRKDVLRTLEQLVALGAFEQMARIRTQREQTWLDLVGDAAHALHALDLSAGDAVLAVDLPEPAEEASP